MLRVRFRANIADPRPVNWPVKHPFWVTGEVMWATKRTAYPTVVSYADDENYIFENWPEASHLKIITEVDDYQFTERFPKPDWWPPEEQVPEAKTPDEDPTIIEDFPTSRVSGDYVRSLPSDEEEEPQDE